MSVSFGYGEKISRYLTDHYYLDRVMNERVGCEILHIPKFIGKFVGNIVYFGCRGFVFRPIVFVLRIFQMLGSFFLALAITQDYTNCKRYATLTYFSFARMLVGVFSLLGATVMSMLQVVNRKWGNTIASIHRSEFYLDLEELDHAGEIAERPLDIEGLIAGRRVGGLLHNRDYIIPQEARNLMARQVGIDIHDRDDQVSNAIQLLRRRQIGERLNIDGEVEEFERYVRNKANVTQEQKQRALHALIGVDGTFSGGFPPFLGNQDRWTIAGGLFTGEEIIARIWAHTKKLPPRDLDTAQHGMFMALVNSYENGNRVCNPGKASRLVHAVLGGNLDGVQLDRVDNLEININRAVDLFFLQGPHRDIQNRDALIAAGNHWLDQNPNVNRDPFIQQLDEYANTTFYEPV